MIIAKISKTLSSNWEDKKAKIKMKFPQLTNADLDFDYTKKQEMVSSLKVKLGKTFKELQAIIETL